ncbi:hypothetical protein CONLIGDRAFT_565360, partial [Coniochaeta ligniaria NRRL 30616]
RLYISHFLSTWNMRSYEFTVILLFAAAYPDSLLPTSIRGVLTNGVTLLLSPAIGSWVDKNASRFHTMKITIVVQRACIVAGCLLWMLLFLTPRSHAVDDSRPKQVLLKLGNYLSKDVIIGILMLFGIFERMCAVGNNLVMERDWVPTIASEVSKPPLHQLNAIMRRIDLVSKILAPVFVSTIAIKTSSVVLVIVTAGINLGTVGIELATARTAWNKCNALKLAREPKDVATVLRSSIDDEDAASVIVVREEIEQDKKGLALYFSSDVCLASLSAALQSFSVLSLSGPMTTYLLTRHYSLSLITTARTAISAVEIGSTLLFPLLASFLSRHPLPYLPDNMAVLGLSGATLQLALLIPCFVALAALPTSSPDPAAAFPALTAAVFVFLGLSRLGHWTHNMAVQQIAQTRVAPRHRVEFSGVEMTFVSGAEIGRWACAAVWSRPSQFTGVAFAGLVSVGVVWGLFFGWIVVERRRR